MGLIDFFRKLLCKGNERPETDNHVDPAMKYLVVGLGNIGAEYAGTRHNIGFMVADHIAEKNSCTFEDSRYGYIGRCRIKNAEVVLLKPSTYMNLSGNAVRYWLQKENIPVERLIVICDDISLPLGKLRIRPQGSDGGHNGLKHIASVLGSQQYVRLKFGVGNNFAKGGQIDYVLGKFSQEEMETITPRIDLASDAVKTFCLCGVTMAMNQYNKL